MQGLVRLAVTMRFYGYRASSPPSSPSFLQSFALPHTGKRLCYGEGASSLLAPQSQEARYFPFPAPLTASPDRKRKRFLAFARNDDAGKRLRYREGDTLPPSFGRRWRGAPEVGFRSGLKKNVRCASPVSSSRAQPRDLFRFPFPFSFVMPSA